MSTAPVITIFVRHNPDCRYRDDETYKRCDCRKHLRWFANGEQQRKKAGTRSWAEAEKIKRDLEDQLAGRAPAKEEPKSKPLDEAVKTLIQDKRVEGLTANVIGKYTRELNRFVEFCAGEKVYTVDGITRELLTRFCATWETVYPSSTTRRVVRDRLRSFLLYCFQAQWIARAPQMPKIKLEYAETLPLSAEEYKRLLDTVWGYEPEQADKGRPSGWTYQTRQRVHALFQLMRWSGLRISDALTLERGELQFSEAKNLYRILRKKQQKTGQPVYIPIPTDVAKELLEVLNGNPQYFFWSGNGQPRTITQDFGRYIRPIFKAAKLDGGQMKAHRLRDTFAVDLLEKGVPLEEVSKLLGHQSIKTTEKHYAKWVKGRQDRLDALVTGTWDLTKQKGRGKR